MTICCWAKGLPLRVVSSMRLSWRKLIFFLSASGYQLEIASGLGMGVYIHLSSLLYNPIWCRPMIKALCMNATLCVSSYVHQPVVSRTPRFFRALHPLWLLQYLVKVDIKGGLRREYVNILKIPTTLSKPMGMCVVGS